MRLEAHLPDEFIVKRRDEQNTKSFCLLTQAPGRLAVNLVALQKPLRRGGRAAGDEPVKEIVSSKTLRAFSESYHCAPGFEGGRGMLQSLVALNHVRIARRSAAANY